MLRIHFGTEDLTRTTVAPSGDVLWELLLSLHTLQERTEELPFNSWRRRVCPLIPRPLHPLFELAPPRGYSADFLTPTRGTHDLQEGLAAVLRAPAKQIMRDFGELAAQRRTPFVARAGDVGTSRFVRRMANGLKKVFDIAIAPYWRQISRDIETDRARHIRTLSGEGVERLLETLHPYARWRHPVLEIDEYVDQDLHLGGRGLVLIPSFFCRHHPVTLLDTERPPVLIFPVARRNWLLEEDQDEPASAPLAALLGRARTAVLETSVNGCSTTDMARAAGISPASVSHHTKVLRQAGLITTERDGHHVCHRITDLGRALLESSTADGIPTAPTPAGPDRRGRRALPRREGGRGPQEIFL